MPDLGNIVYVGMHYYCMSSDAFSTLDLLIDDIEYTTVSKLANLDN